MCIPPTECNPAPTSGTGRQRGLLDPVRWLYRLMSSEENAHLIGNLVGAMQGVPREIQPRQVCHCHEADAPYKEGVARGPGLHVEGLMVI